MLHWKSAAKAQIAFTKVTFPLQKSIWKTILKIRTHIFYIFLKFMFRKKISLNFAQFSFASEYLHDQTQRPQIKITNQVAEWPYTRKHSLISLSYTHTLLKLFFIELSSQLPLKAGSSISIHNLDITVSLPLRQGNLDIVENSGTCHQRATPKWDYVDTHQNCNRSTS